MRMTDREIERLAARLGGGADTQLDVERVAKRVAARLRAAGGPVRARPAARWLALAAGVALVVGTAWFTLGRDATPPVLGTAPGLVPGLSDLSVTELHQVLDSLTPRPAAGLAGRATLDDLDSEQLETLLTMMEG